MSEIETNIVDQEEETDDETARIDYLIGFVGRLLAAPLKKKGKKETPVVDVKITTDDIRILTMYASLSFKNQSSLLKIDEESLPIHIVGDLHGQFHDLRLLFSRCGHPSQTNYIFLGDYVDRGLQGIETSCLLMALQCLYPKNIFMVRGNHEDYNTTLTYGFYDECLMKYAKYGEIVWLSIISAFNHLPFAALIFGRILCMHGGISPNLKSLADIDKIVRPTMIPAYGLACDLVWSDPENTQNPGFSLSSRGISFSFDDSAIQDFCQKNGLDLIIRAHQISSDMYRGGHKFHAGGNMVTIFSAPNYLNMGNDSCVVRVEKSKLVRFIVFRPTISK
ncbi:unnamed protein product [Caenorhabditis angaria]|uniref:Serine/threonine-protein phosphatase n=1 Tax=Caenorhabditis angaria TaxID=860376 RepID=A0A9P1IJA5_9PELO|nr:unnamed protein product [Caenorhabditis angaria]